MKLQGVSLPPLGDSLPARRSEHSKAHGFRVLEAHPRYFHSEPTDDQCFGFVFA